MNSKMENRKKEQSQKKEHLCSYCGKTYSRADYLKQHIGVTHEGETVECKCGAKFDFTSSLQKHQLKCSKFKSENLKMDLISNEEGRSISNYFNNNNE